MDNSIDPLLFRGMSLEEMNRISQFKKKHSESGNAFGELWNKRLNKDYQLSTSQISRQMTREQIYQDISESEDKRRVYEAAQEFEGYFMETVFKEMKKTLSGSKLIDGGRAEEIFDDMLTTERVRAMAVQSDWGLAEDMYRDLQGL